MSGTSHQDAASSVYAEHEQEDKREHERARASTTDAAKTKTEHKYSKRLRVKQCDHSVFAELKQRGWPCLAQSFGLIETPESGKMEPYSLP